MNDDPKLPKHLLDDSTFAEMMERESKASGVDDELAKRRNLAAIERRIAGEAQDFNKSSSTRNSKRAPFIATGFGVFAAAAAALTLMVLTRTPTPPVMLPGQVAGSESDTGIKSGSTLQIVPVTLSVWNATTAERLSEGEQLSADTEITFRISSTSNSAATVIARTGGGSFECLHPGQVMLAGVDTSLLSNETASDLIYAVSSDTEPLTVCALAASQQKELDRIVEIINKDELKVPSEIRAAMDCITFGDPLP